MAIHVITDGKIYVDGYNLSASFNELTVDVALEMKDTTSFGTAGTRTFIPGLQNASFSGKGLQDYDSSVNQAIDKTVFDLVGATAASILSFARVGSAENDVALAMKGVTAQITPLAGSHGDLVEFTISGQAGGTRLIHGIVLAVGTKSSTGLSTALNLGAVTATQRIYASLHAVRPVTGTLDMIVRSDDAVGMASPTTRLTFTQMNAIGAQWLEAAGPITDTYWQASWTIGAGSFPIFLVFAIH
jgi:hypothetical protein